MSDRNTQQPFDRFEFEQEIMACWNVIDDLKLLSTSLSGHDFNKEHTIEVLNGIRILYAMKFEKLFDTFETGVKNKHIIHNK